jgi:ATP-dependent DNA helicase RecG
MGYAVAMRPDLLNPLFGDVTLLRGVGEAVHRQLARLDIEKPLDLLLHCPVGRLRRTWHADLSSARSGETIILPVTIIEHDGARGGKGPLRIQCVDDAGEPLTLVFFSNPGDYISKRLPKDQRRVISGTLEMYQNRFQMVHPDHIVLESRVADIPLDEPIYPLTEGMGQKRLGGLIAQVLERTPVLPEWIDGPLVQRQNWPGWREAIEALHKAGSSEARARLAYDELFANQLALAMVRARVRKDKGRAFAGAPPRALPMPLPFALTTAQHKAVDEILADLASDAPMLRLLQGDVGSGKTVVALLAAARIASFGVQTALLAPTEILARQHLATFEKMAAASGLRVALLTGREKGKPRAAILEALAGGEIDVLIGTHALFTEDVAYKDLGLIIIDEQHKFGVHQRLMLSAKALSPPHLLVMTATPIPRTLTLTFYGELDVSVLNERPPGRQPIDTRVVALDRLDDVYDGVARNLASGGRCYWVCPLVEESEKIDLAAAEVRAAHLMQRFGDDVALVHGRLKSAEKDAAMQAFARGEKRILVSTTVIEVGVDVAEANLMVIEQAERFGLAQLHQLRGRVGRGAAKSVCLLLRGAHLSETARARLGILRDTDDGFRIAEEDLRLRGAGEVLGTKQSGLPEFKIADPALHGDLLMVARDDARLLLERDAHLTSERGRAARLPLYLFDRVGAAGLLRSG